MQLKRLPGQDAGDRNNVILGKMEGNNPAGSVKDRPALAMIKGAEARGQIKPGDTLIEATSGNTGIALAMAAAMRGYKMILLMPENLSLERRQSMAAYGAEIVLTPKPGGMEYARDLAGDMQKEGKGIILDQFANPDNPRAHYESTGPEIWRDTEGRAPSWASHAISKKKILRFRLLVHSRRKAHKFRVFANGLKPIYPRFLIVAESIRSKMSVRPLLNKWRVGWQLRKGFFAVSRQRVPAKLR